MYKIGVFGATGRVGSKICEFLAKDNEAILSYAYSRLDSLEQLFGSSDIVIDFSVKDALDNLLKFALALEKPLVIGTTGFTSLQKQQMAKAASKIAIFYSPNMTMGAYILKLFLEKYGSAFKKYDINLIETHHRNKKDAPSGTALMFGDIIKENIDNNFENYHSIRGGEGGFSEHEIIFAHGHERVKLYHQIMNSDIFARNSIMIAKWMLSSKKSPGLYLMEDFIHA